MSISYLSIYSTTSGAIVTHHSCTEPLISVDGLLSGFDCIDGLYAPDDYYVLDGEIAERPSAPEVTVSVVADSVLCEGVPIGATVSLRDLASVVAEADEVEFAEVAAGTYTVTVDAWPAQLFTEIVTVE